MRSTFESNGVQLVGHRLDADGAKGFAILLHGGGQTRNAWAATAARLTTAGWSTLAMDARGHGESSWAPDGDYSMDALVGDLAGVVESLQVAPVLIGASMGGLTGLLAVGEGRLRARGLVMVDVAPRVETAGIKRIHAFMTAAPDGFASLQEAADSIASYNPHRRRPPNLASLERNLRLGEDGRWRWHWDPVFMTIPDEPTRALRHRRYVRAAEKVQIPTLMVRGGESDVVSEAGAAELLRTIPGAGEVVVPAAGHMVAGDDNDQFSRELLSFLGHIDAGGSGLTPSDVMAAKRRPV